MKVNRVLKGIGGGAVAVAVGALLLVGSVHAASVGDISRHGTEQAGSLLILVQAIIAIIGVCFVAGGFMAVKAANKSEGQAVKYSVGIVSILVGCAMFYISSVMQTGGDTVWQGGGTRSTLTITQ